MFQAFFCLKFRISWPFFRNILTFRSTLYLYKADFCAAISHKLHFEIAEKAVLLKESQAYFKSDVLMPFVDKGYGLPLLLELYQVTTESRDYGVRQIFDNLDVPKPAYNAFRAFLDRLVSGGSVVLVQSRRKANRKIPTLSTAAIAEIERIENTHS
jgi:hypothetical protein